MALARDNTSSGEASGGSVTFNHTISGNSRLLIVVGANYNETDGSVSTATFNGTAMIPLGASVYNGTNPKFAMRAFYLINPPVGTYEVIVSSSGHTSAVSASYIGASQSNQPDNSESPVEVAEAGQTTDGITTVANNAWAFMAVATHVTGGLTGDESAVEVISRSSTVVLQNYYVYLFDTNGPKTPAGEVLMAVDRVGSNQHIGYQLFSISPATGTSQQIIFI